jgi:hypothetical protein
MGTTSNPINAMLDREARTAARNEAGAGGIIGGMATAYVAATSERLLGFLLKMGYDELHLVTCDAWKLKCGGVPKNSFVIIKLNEDAAGLRPGTVRQSLVLARVTESATTPVDTDIQSTIFEIHKVQAHIDPLTNVELQWGALKANILGTYYDTPEGAIAFGNDIDSFLAPHFYEVYVPTDDDLEVLINSFVADTDPLEIGRLRYTETEIMPRGRLVSVRVSPGDFVSNRTALFGKTRMGKSNTIKVILDTMLRSHRNVGQIVYDLAGEYSYPDPQTGASLYLRHRDQCSRYSLNPRRPQQDVVANVPAPAVLRANFFEQVELGHATISGLYQALEPRIPDYIQPVLTWEPVDEPQIDGRFPDMGERTRYKRARSLYFAVLEKAGFQPPTGFSVNLELKEDIRIHLAALADLSGIGSRRPNSQGVMELTSSQPIGVATRIYEKLYEVWRDPANAQLFPVSQNSGKPYFEAIHQALLRMLGDSAITGAGKFTSFVRYHSPDGSDIVARIAADVNNGRTVMIDLSNANEVVATYYSELITKAVFALQVEKFSRDALGDHSVLFYFEEAHHLFRADDKDLTSIYNRLAKEGAKFHIGMVYATQSMTTLSPDLLKNTENFLIAHLNDDREIREIERRYEFTGIGLDVQRARTKGYVRMITLSHRYVLPVQIKLFRPTDEPRADPQPNGEGSNGMALSADRTLRSTASQDDGRR